MFPFLKENWIEFGSGLAGFASLVLGLIGYLSGKKTEQADFSFSVDKSYERVWSKHNGNPALVRITEDKVDLETHPVTLEEERFVLLLLNHLTSTVRAIDLGKYEKPLGMEADVTSFFKKPIPNAIAGKYLTMQSKEVRKLLREVMN